MENTSNGMLKVVAAARLLCDNCTLLKCNLGNCIVTQISESCEKKCHLYAKGEYAEYLRSFATDIDNGASAENVLSFENWVTKNTA